MAIKLHPSMAVHPGPWLRRNVVEHYRLTVTELAERLHVSRPAMSNLLGGKADLSPTMALRFEAAFGIGAETLLRMQTAHDLAEAREGADGLGVERVAEAA
ncbi:MAG: HigA family addiction module antitoxin [Novosphingobium sp.]